jgi:hypothetical protein
MRSDISPTIPASDRPFAVLLLVAMLAHGLLLLIPYRHAPGPKELLRTLSVTLESRLRPQALPGAEQAEPPQQATESAPAISAPPALAAPSEPPPTALGEPNLAPELPRTAPTEPPPSAALLFGSANRLRLPAARPESSRRLGEPAPELPPHNWRSGIPYPADRFEGRTLPDQLEVVDRWLAADGSHNVMVQTPTGEMLCGRAEAWDPMRPLVEPVMMFRVCGSGKSTFEWPDEYRAGAAAAQPAAGRP